MESQVLPIAMEVVPAVDKVFCLYVLHQSLCVAAASAAYFTIFL